MPADDDWTKVFARNLTNRDLADILEFSSYYHEAEIAVSAMREAAKRPREPPEPHYVVSPRPNLPSLTAYAVLQDEISR